MYAESCATITTIQGQNIFITIRNLLSISIHSVSHPRLPVLGTPGYILILELHIMYFHTDGTMQYVIHGDCLLLFSRVFPRLILLVPRVSTQSFQLPDNILLQGHAVDTWVISTFWPLWIKLLWTFVYKFLCEHMLSFLLGIHLEVKLLGHGKVTCGSSLFSFLQNFQTIFQSGSTILHSHEHCLRFQFFHVLLNTRYFSFFPFSVL